MLMIIFLLPVPEYPTLDCEMTEFEKDMYKEDGSLEVDILKSGGFDLSSTFPIYYILHVHCYKKNGSVVQTMQL
jgi:hypothetical protein